MGWDMGESNRARPIFVERDRDPWEALDLGLRLAAQRPLFFAALWLGLALPALIPLAALLRADPSLFWLAAFWLKPAQEPGMARAMAAVSLGGNPGFLDCLVNGWRLSLTKRLLGDLTWRRLDPTRFAKTFLIRSRELYPQLPDAPSRSLSSCSMHCAWSGFIGVHIEQAFAYGIFYVAWFLLTPFVQYGNPVDRMAAVWQLFYSQMFSGAEAAASAWLFSLCFVVALAAWQPFYAGAMSSLAWHAMTWSVSNDVERGLAAIGADRSGRTGPGRGAERSESDGAEPNLGRPERAESSPAAGPGPRRGANAPGDPGLGGEPSDLAGSSGSTGASGGADEPGATGPRFSGAAFLGAALAAALSWASAGPAQAEGAVGRLGPAAVDPSGQAAPSEANRVSGDAVFAAAKSGLEGVDAAEAALAGPRPEAAKIVDGKPNPFALSLQPDCDATPPEEKGQAAPRRFARFGSKTPDGALCGSAFDYARPTTIDVRALSRLAALSLQGREDARLLARHTAIKDMRLLNDLNVLGPAGFAVDPQGAPGPTDARLAELLEQKQAQAALSAQAMRLAPRAPQTAQATVFGRTAQPRDAERLREALLKEPFGRFETVKIAPWADSEADSDGSKLPDLRGWAPRFDAAKAALSIASYVLLCLAIYLSARAILRAAKEAQKAQKPPETLFDLDVRPESLPKDVGAAARELFPASARAAVSLVFRACLSKLIHLHRLPLGAGMTENEILDLCARLAPETHRAAQSAFSVWIDCAYAHEVIPIERLNAMVLAYERAIGAPSARSRSFDAAEQSERARPRSRLGTLSRLRGARDRKSGAASGADSATNGGARP